MEYDKLIAPGAANMRPSGIRKFFDIAAETDYNYPPLLGIVFKNAFDLHRSALFMPRFGGTISLL